MDLYAKDVAAILKCSVAKVNSLRKDGILPAVKFGRSYLYDSDDIDSLKKRAKEHNLYLKDK